MSFEHREGTSIGKYKLENRLWKGTFGESWKAIYQNQSVVVQFIHNPKMLECFQGYPPKILHESHPGLVKLLSWEAQQQALIWEHTSGRTLYNFINELKKIKINIAVYIARKLLEISNFMVSKGLLHGGIRPTRIIITPEKKVKLTNFGIGHVEQRILSDLYPDISGDETGAIAPYYPSEVLEDKLFDDPKSDIYAVGIILAEMLTGKRVQGSEIPKLLYDNKIKKRLAAIILKAVAEFEGRYNHPNEMHRDLTSLLKSVGKVDKIYVPPPAVKNAALEAVPADSEEYRVYQAEQISAKQTIDAEVVMAEPAEIDEDFETETPPLSTEQAAREIQRILHRTGRIDADSVVKIATIDNKILDPLEKEPLWPTTFCYYGAACLIFLVLILSGAYFLRPSDFDTKVSGSAIWILLPLGTLQLWPPLLQKIIHIVFLLISVGLFTIPFWDKYGRFVLNSFFIPFLSTLLSGIVGLGFWQQVNMHGGWWGLSGQVVCCIFLLMGGTIGVAIPILAGYLRRQIEISALQRIRKENRGKS